MYFFWYYIGRCIYDYRHIHCGKCGNHYHGVHGMGTCYHCHPGATKEADID